MNRANHNRLNSPIITRVIELNKRVVSIRKGKEFIEKHNGKNRYIRRVKNKRKNGVLIAKFYKKMKYGKLINETLDIKDVEKGVGIGGSLTEEEIIKGGYKPVCEVEKPSDANSCIYKEYETCFVQEWITENTTEDKNYE